jgi:uncharacterized protein (DUF2062 family)
LRLSVDIIERMTKETRESITRKITSWLRQGISPQRLALTLALGFAIGCIPILGIPTALCTLLALALGLNMPAIQAANYVMTPVQVALIVPFVRLGMKLFAFGPRTAFNAHAFMHASPLATLSLMGGLAGKALLAWLLIAIPAVALMTVTLTVLLRRVPMVAAASSAD